MGKEQQSVLSEAEVECVARATAVRELALDVLRARYASAGGSVLTWKRDGKRSRRLAATRRPRGGSDSRSPCGFGAYRRLTATRRARFASRRSPVSIPARSIVVIAALKGSGAFRRKALFMSWLYIVLGVGVAVLVLNLAFVFLLAHSRADTRSNAESQNQ